MSSNPSNTTANTAALQVLAGRDLSRDLAPLRDIEAELQRQALQSTARFVSDDMREARAMASREHVLESAMDHLQFQGLMCEFGVADGHTIRLLANRTRHTIHGFDSFEGLPESWNGFEAGTFACELPVVPKNVMLHPGWFAETLPPFVKSYREPVALLHIDCDLYSSTKTILDRLKSQIVHGTVIVFDEFFNYPGWQHHEARAWSQFVRSQEFDFNYKYLYYNKFGEQVALQIL